jgi:hypothetical protein
MSHPFLFGMSIIAGSYLPFPVDGEQNAFHPAGAHTTGRHTAGPTRPSSSRLRGFIMTLQTDSTHSGQLRGRQAALQRATPP